MSSSQAATGRVAVLLVSHDGAAWLPGVLAGLAEQTVPAHRYVAVDTGSRDDGPALVAASGLPWTLVETSSSTSYPQAVDAGLERLGALDPDVEWVWLLHDDSRPAPDALERLLAAAAERSGVDVLGPKLREWPSLRRLLELGVTISGTGRRETGLERGEYDQGQHDQRREVLAVNTAGMLVRRRVLEELGGFDAELPVFGNDVDFGWRAAARGHTTLVVPDAVVFHAEAAHRGVRRTALTGRHTHYQERRAALYTLLANGGRAGLPWRVVRLTVGTVLRVLGLLAVRAVGEALDELAALGSVLASPGRLRAARRRRAVPEADHRRARPLLAPWWLPYRHGLDLVGDVVSALTQQASDVAERRRLAAAEADPSSLAAQRLRAERAAADDDEDGLTDTGVVARFLTSPVALTLAAVVLLALVAGRTALGSVSGGALSPVPAGAGDWWALHLRSWQPLGFGTDVPAPAYVPLLALLATAVGTTWAVSLVLVLAVPLALWGAWRFLRVAGRMVSPVGAPRWLLVLGATTYALVPVTSGAWGSGRLGLVVVAALLPWTAHAALGFVDPDPDRRWRAGWRVGLLLAVAAAFAPVTWWLAALLLVVVLAVGALVARRAVAARAVWGPPAAAVAVPVVLLLPWWLPTLTAGAGGALLLDTGRLPGPALEPLDLLAGRVADTAPPAWLGLLLLVLAALALVPRSTRIPALLCWLVALVATALAAVLGRIDVALVAGTSPAGLGALVVVVQGALVGAAVLGAQGALRARGPDESRPPALRALAAAVAVAAAVVPVGGLAWFLLEDGDLRSTPPEAVPAYMEQGSVTAAERGILVVRGDTDSGLTFTVRRDDGVTLGEDEVLALEHVDARTTETLRTLLSRPRARTVDELAALGVEHVLLPAPADGSVAATLDAQAGLVQASSGPGSRAWRVDEQLDPDAVSGPGGHVLRPVLLAVQGLGAVVVLVLCAPSVRAARREEQP